MFQTCRRTFCCETQKKKFCSAFFCAVEAYRDRSGSMKDKEPQTSIILVVSCLCWIPACSSHCKELREAVKTTADESDEWVNDDKGFTFAPAARWENVKGSSCGRDGIVSRVFPFSSSSQTVTWVSAVCHWLYMKRLWKPEEIWNQMFPFSEEMRPVFIC